MNLPVIHSPDVAVAMAAGYATLIVVVSLVATLHPDPLRRADARRVLDRLIRLYPRRR